MDNNSMGGILERESCLSADNIDFINKGYKKFSRVPTETELEVCGEILNDRRKFASGFYFSDVKCDNTAVTETFKDLKEKAKALYGADFFPASFSDWATVLEEYMRGIGRVDESVRSTEYGEAVGGMTVFDSAGRAVFTFDKAPRSRKRRKGAMQYGDMAVIYLDAHEGDAERFLADEGLKKLRKIVVKIGEYGIIGALCRCAFIKGVKADFSRLPNGAADVNTLVCGHRGEYILITEKKFLAPLKKLAEGYGVQPIYFACLSKSKLIEGNSNAPCVFPLDTLRKLISSGKEIIPAVSIGDGALELSNTEVVGLGEYLFACAETDGKAGFLGVADIVTYLILSLVSRGVDRRAVALAFDYRLKGRIESPDSEMSEALGLCLGAYRVGVEIATPVGITDVRYSYGDNSLLCMAYGARPRQVVKNDRKENEGNLYFMPVEHKLDGLVDFGKLRKTCDKFTELCAKGRVVGAVAVHRGDLAKEVERMSAEGELLLDKSKEDILADKREGFLFVCKGKCGGSLIGKLTNKTNEMA